MFVLDKFRFPVINFLTWMLVYIHEDDRCSQCILIQETCFTWWLLIETCSDIILLGVKPLHSQEEHNPQSWKLNNWYWYDAIMFDIHLEFNLKLWDSHEYSVSWILWNETQNNTLVYQFKIMTNQNVSHVRTIFLNLH